MAATEETSIRDLFRTLLKHTPRSEEQLPPEALVEEIIFDLEVDGARYLFIRLPKANHLPVQLSPREREIVRLVALGHSNKIIADVLNISSWTVCTHLRRVFAKLGVGSRAAMVANVAEIARTGADCSGRDAREAGVPHHCPASPVSSASRIKDGEPLASSLRLASPSALSRR
jgi:DNA-binding CsgD family transcriptional regulator